MLPGAPDIDRRAATSFLQIVTRESDRLNNIITDFLAYCARQAVSLLSEVNLVPLSKTTLHPARTSPDDAENTGIGIERAFLASASACARRWGQDQAGVLEFLRERGTGDEDGGGTLPCRSVNDWRGLADQLSPTPVAGMSPAAVGKNLRAIPVWTSRAAPGWVWRSSTRSCRRTRARCGRARELGEGTTLSCCALRRLGSGGTLRRSRSAAIRNAAAAAGCSEEEGARG